MIERYCDSTIPPVDPAALTEEDTFHRKQIQVLGESLDLSLSHFSFNNVLLHIASRVSDIDVFIDRNEPWKLAKVPEKRARLNAVLYEAAEALRIFSFYLSPFMPETAEKISNQLGVEIDFRQPLLANPVAWSTLPSGTKIRKGSALFPRILDAEPGAYSVTGDAAKLSSQGAKTVSETPAQPTATPAATPAASSQPSAPASPAAHITIDEFMKIELKTARILSAERVPRSEKLLKLQVSLGNEQRQIVAGIGKKYEPETLVGKTIVIVANLKPAKLMGIESQGMVLAAGDAEVRGLATFIEDVEPGTKVK
jgi:methionyl-tRNA synthetase